MATEITEHSCGINPFTGAFSLAAWRDEAAARCERLGWEVPAVYGMEGYRLFNLCKLLFDAELKSGLREIPVDALGHRVIMDANHNLTELKSMAEALPVESEFDQQYVRDRRESRERAADEERARGETIAQGRAENDERREQFTGRGYRP